MTTTAQSVIQRAVVALQDPNSTRWATVELVRYLNDGQRDIALIRPDATATLFTMGLVAGARQNLPEVGAKLLDVIRNTTGSKRAVRLVNRNVLDAHNPDWYSKAGALEVKHYTFDAREPRVFYVYPPATTGASVELVYSAYPANITEPSAGALYTAVSGYLSVQDIFANALTNYILYRAYSKDTESVNAAAAAAYYQLYQSMLGIELSGTTGVAPKD